MISGLVSTIIPVFNRADLLAEAVASVLAQTHRPVEVVIVDDGSTDATPSAIGELERGHAGVVRSVRRVNGGPGLARQSGLDVAGGEFIQFLDSDDLLLPQKFQLQVAALQARPECGIAYGKTRHYKLGSEPRNDAFKRTGERFDTLYPALLRSRWWSTSTPLYRRTLLDRVGSWSELRNEEDWEYECRIAALGTRLAYCDAFVSDTRYHDRGQLSDGGSIEVWKLKHRAEAHRMMHGHATRAAVPLTSPEMQHFARELFLLARQCGAAGLGQEARMLFQLARKATLPERAGSLEFRAYAACANLVGWTATGRLAGLVDRWRGRIAQ